MKKKRFILLSIAVISLLVYTFSGWFPLVISNDDHIIFPHYNKEAHHSFFPFEKLRVTPHTVAYLVIAPSDMEELPEHIPHKKVLYCDDLRILRKLKNDFECTASNGDMSTCESQLIVYEGSKKVFQTSIVITKHLIGIQNAQTGWAVASQPASLRRLFSRFKPSWRLLFYV